MAEINDRRLDPDHMVDQTECAVNAGVEVYTVWTVGLPGEDEVALHETEELIDPAHNAVGRRAKIGQPFDPVS